MKKGAAALVLLRPYDHTGGAVRNHAARWQRRGRASFVTMRLIALFRESDGPADSTFLARPSREAGTALAYAGPVPGAPTSCVHPYHPEGVTDLVRRLRQSPQIVDVQLDVSVSAQKP